MGPDQQNSVCTPLLWIYLNNKLRNHPFIYGSNALILVEKKCTCVKQVFSLASLAQLQQSWK